MRKKIQGMRRISTAAALIVVLVIVLTGTALADINDAVSFPDAKLKNALLALPGADADGSGTLTEGEMEALTGPLMLSGLGISDITGLEFAKGVTQINLSGNTIREISALSGLALTSLDVSDNYLDLSAGSSDMTVITTLQGAGCTVTSEPQKVPVSGISLSRTSLLICPNDKVTLTATVAPNDATDKAVSWTSANEDIASVDSNGLVTAVNMGTVDITAVTHDGDFKAVCTVTIQADKIASSKYLIGGGRLSRVAKRTSILVFKAGLLSSAGIHVYKTDGKELTNGTICTGMTVALSVGGVERDRLTIIVNGDTNGDGTISITDYTLTRYDILALKPLQGAFHTAGDVNGDGKVSISDYTAMRYDILGLKQINDSKPATPNLPAVSDPRIRAFINMALAQQGKPYVWGAEGPDSFDCSGFIHYCLNQTGYAVGRTTADTYSRRSTWKYVDKDDLQPGDLMFYYSDNPSDGDHIGHTGIYLGNGYHIHASSSYGYVVICRVEGWYDTMLSHGRRVFY